MEYRVAHYDSPELTGDKGREKVPSREILGALRHFADHMSRSDLTVAIWHSPGGNSEDPLVRSRLVEIPHQQITATVKDILHDMERAEDLASFDLAYLDSVARAYGCRFRKSKKTLRLFFPGPDNSEGSGLEVKFQRRQIRISCHEQSVICHSEWQITPPASRRRDVLAWIARNAGKSSPRQSTGK